jgi:phosphoribosylaminoimidazole carboxylase (NCAIR synthetase)
MPAIPIHAPECVLGVIGGGQLGRMLALPPAA